MEIFMNKIICFFTDPTERAASLLRRYNPNEKCPGKYCYHNAQIQINEVDYPMSEYDGEGGLNFDKKDLRWPNKCAYCDYIFKDSDQWQHNLDRIYQEVNGSRRFALRDAPVGAMWYARWQFHLGPDGKSLYVVTPGGEWCIDSPANNSKTPWTRSGIPPKITARPSILIGDRYHGFLTEGVLESC